MKRRICYQSCQPIKVRADDILIVTDGTTKETMTIDSIGGGKYDVLKRDERIKTEC